MSSLTLLAFLFIFVFCPANIAFPTCSFFYFFLLFILLFCFCFRKNIPKYLHTEWPFLFCQTPHSKVPDSESESLNRLQKNQQICQLLLQFFFCLLFQILFVSLPGSGIWFGYQYCRTVYIFCTLPESPAQNPTPQYLLKSMAFWYVSENIPESDMKFQIRNAVIFDFAVCNYIFCHILNIVHFFCSFSRVFFLYTYSMPEFSKMRNFLRIIFWSLRSAKNQTKPSGR